MKRMILCAGLLFLLAGMAAAQTTNKKATAKKQYTTHKKNTAGKDTKKENTQTEIVSIPGTTYLVSNGSYSAFSNTRSGIDRYTIADPTIRTLNARANGANMNISSSGIVGVPKRAYGFARGQIILMPDGARTTGTMTGSGATGTGTSIGIVGSGGPAMGVNGKNPYAGWGIYGIPNTGIRLNDTATRAQR